MSDRTQKLNELIRQLVSDIILKEVECPDTLITVTGVETTDDLHYAKIFISVLPNDKFGSAIKALKRAKMDNMLFKKLSMKIVPKLQFVIDDTEAKATEIEQLLDQIKKKE